MGKMQNWNWNWIPWNRTVPYMKVPYVTYIWLFFTKFYSSPRYNLPFSRLPFCRPWIPLECCSDRESRNVVWTLGRGSCWGIPVGKSWYPPTHRYISADPAQGASLSFRPGKRMEIVIILYTVILLGIPVDRYWFPLTQHYISADPAPGVKLILSAL